MSPTLQSKFQILNERSNKMVDRVRAYNPTLQNAPVGRSFSPVHALEHMAMTEKLYADLTTKTDLVSLEGKQGKPNFIFRFILKAMAKPAGRVSPTIKDFTPTGVIGLEESAKLWSERRNRVVEHLSRFQDDQAALKHPLFGMLSPNDVFNLLNKHQDYHDIRLP
jgi:hypothetical protein